MTQILAFEEVNANFISSLKYKRIVLDASFLAKVYFKNLHAHKECVDLLDQMQNKGVSLVANATVKSELLDFTRRSLLTDFFFNQIETSDLKFPSETKKLVHELQENKLAASRGNKTDPILQDTELNHIRDHLCLLFDESDESLALSDSKIKKFRDHLLHRQGISGVSTWAKVCEVFLSGRIEQIDQLLNQSGIMYLGHEDINDKQLLEVGKVLDWNQAVEISEYSGCGFWDSMLINFAESIRVDLIVTLDKDLAYSYAASNRLKRKVLTTSKIKKFLNKIRF